MYVYDIGYDTCEESGYNQYSHEKQFSKDDLYKIVEDAMFEALKLLKDLNSEWKSIKHPNVSTLMSWIRPSVEDEMKNVFADHLKAMGFVPIKFEASISFFGWAMADVPGDWDSSPDTIDYKLQKSLKERWEEWDKKKVKAEK